MDQSCRTFRGNWKESVDDEIKRLTNQRHKAMIQKLLASLFQKLTTEKFVTALTLLLLSALVKSTKNNLDDQALEMVRKALEEESGADAT